MTPPPPEGHPGSKRILSWFVSYWCLSRQFQFSLSAAALDMYLFGWHYWWRHGPVRRSASLPGAAASTRWPRLPRGTAHGQARRWSAGRLHNRKVGHVTSGHGRMNWYIPILNVCFSLKLTCRNTFRHSFAFLRTNSTGLPHPPCIYHVRTVYTYIRWYKSDRNMGGRGEVNQREVREATVHKMGQNYQHEWMYLQSIKSVKHLPQSRFYRIFKNSRHLGFLCLFRYLVHASGLLLKLVNSNEHPKSEQELNFRRLKVYSFSTRHVTKRSSWWEQLTRKTSFWRMPIKSWVRIVSISRAWR